MKFAVVKFTDIKGLTSDISLKPRLIDMCLETISSKPHSLTLWSPLIHVRIWESVPVTSNKQSRAPMQLSLHHQSDSVEWVYIIRILPFHILQEPHPLRFSIHYGPFICGSNLLSLMRGRLICHDSIRMHNLYRDLFVFVCTSLDLPNRHIFGILQTNDLPLLLILIVLHDSRRFNVPIQWIPSFGLFLPSHDWDHHLVTHLIMIGLDLFHLLIHCLI